MAGYTTSAIYNGPIFKGNKRVPKKPSSLKKNEMHRDELIARMKKVRNETKEILNAFKKRGILEFRVKDAPNSVWQKVPENWDSYDLSCEEYRVITAP